MEEYKAKSHAVKKMIRRGLVDADSKEGTVMEFSAKDNDGRRINEADFELQRKGAPSRADPDTLSINTDANAPMPDVRNRWCKSTGFVKEMVCMRQW